MKNIAVIFAGGVGQRMKTVSRPKQFLELNGKPIMIYTIELFDNHLMIDGIVCVCIVSYSTSPVKVSHNKNERPFGRSFHL